MLQFPTSFQIIILTMYNVTISNISIHLSILQLKLCNIICKLYIANSYSRYNMLQDPNNFILCYVSNVWVQNYVILWWHDKILSTLHLSCNNLQVPYSVILCNVCMEKKLENLGHVTAFVSMNVRRFNKTREA